MRHIYTITNTSLKPLDQVEYLERERGVVVVKNPKRIEEVYMYIQHMQQNDANQIKKKYDTVSKTLWDFFSTNEGKTEEKNEECLVSLISDYVGLLMCVSRELHFLDKKTSVVFSNLLFKLDTHQRCSDSDFDLSEYYKCTLGILTILQNKKKKNKKNKRTISYYIDWSNIKIF
jgi:hypothetical protein